MLSHEKTKFSAEFPEYGYGGIIDNLRSEHFSRLKEVIYLDHAGSTLYSEKQMRECNELFTNTLFANPHSQNSASKQTHLAIHNAREMILNSFNTTSDEYSVIFTSGATSALKLVGECFPWSKESEYCYTIDNHTSILGIRQFAQVSGASFSVVDEHLKCCCSSSLCQAWGKRALQKNTSSATNQKPHSLFAFPAESNFSGRLYNLDWISHIQKNGTGHTKSNTSWKVLVDTTKYCSTHAFDLTKYPADFVTVSFYKLFGYPTGSGCLIVKNDSVATIMMEKTQHGYFGGGTVEAAVGNDAFWKPRERLMDRYESGSLSFLSIASLSIGYKQLNSLTFKQIGLHLSALTRYLVTNMRSLRHTTPNTPVCEVYGHEAGVCYGPLVAFNLLRPSGAYVGYAEVDRLATIAGIQLRTGCFCNQGACQHYLKISAEQVRANLEAGHSCGDDNDLIEGRPTGAVRVSLGYMSTFEDVFAFLQFLKKFIDEEPSQQFLTSSSNNEFTSSKHIPSSPSSSSLITSTAVASTSLSLCTLAHILLYPIKSCGFMQVEEWPLQGEGLLYDRRWLLFDPSSNVVFNQKMIPQLCLIKPFLNLAESTLTLSSPHMPSPLVISCGPVEGKKRMLKDCGDAREATVYGAEEQRWLSAAVGRACQLAQGPASFANTGQFLMVSEASLVRLREMTKESSNEGDLLAFGQRFRPNFIIKGNSPFEEDNWGGVTIGDQSFVVSSQCVRCVMVNVDQSSGSNKSSLYATLGSVRRKDGQNITFGVLLQLQTPTASALTLSCGLKVVPWLKQPEANTCKRETKQELPAPQKESRTLTRVPWLLLSVGLLAGIVMARRSEP